MKTAAALAASTVIAAGVFVMSGFQAAAPAKMNPDQALIAGFKKSTVASVADAVDQIVGQRGFMSHDMRPRVPGQIVGRATTAILRQAPAEKASPALSAPTSPAPRSTPPTGATPRRCGATPSTTCATS